MNGELPTSKQAADEWVRKKLLPGTKLVSTLRGHRGRIARITWSPDGRMLASPSLDGTIRLWDVATGRCLRKLGDGLGAFKCAAFSPVSPTIAGANAKGMVSLWDITTGQELWCTRERNGPVSVLAWSPRGDLVAVGGPSGDISLISANYGEAVTVTLGDSDAAVDAIVWSPDGSSFAVGTQSRKRSVALIAPSNGGTVWEYRTLPQAGNALCLAWSLSQPLIACGFRDSTVHILDSASGRLLRELEGHTEEVVALSFSADGRFLASSQASGQICIWRCDTWQRVIRIKERTYGMKWSSDLAFHPTKPMLATVGSDPADGESRLSRIVHIWELDFPLLVGQEAEATAHYINAKVMLVGDTGVGKSGLSLVLNNQSFQATESTPGRRVWRLDSQEVKVEGSLTQTRETLLWDLAGQPGYRIIHQLHLNEVAVACVIFDGRSETDPLAGVRHWERALRLAQQRQGTSGVPMKKFLVSARNDRGGVSIGEDRVQAILKEFGFDGYFKTSAKEGWAITELRAAIEQAIPWDALPQVSSSQLFVDIKSFLLRVKQTGRLLTPASQLYREFSLQHPEIAGKVSDLRAQFDVCIGRLENRGLIRRLTFGGYVLLQPELLDAYGSAMVNEAKQEPDGLGSMAEEIALAGRFYVPKEQKVDDWDQEQVLLAATVEELVRHDLALRENADDGRYLVFPSQFNRDYEDAPDPRGKAVAITFDGPVQSLYATLAVRLGHSGLFSTGRTEMWRNAAVFTARAGGKCGLFLHEFAEGRGRLILFFPDEDASPETRFNFEEFVLAHARRHAVDDTVELVRFFICPDCGDPVPDSYVKRLREKGKREFDCPCGGTVSLAEPEERLYFRSKIDEMDSSADKQRDFDAFVLSAKGETRTERFRKWAGGEQVTLAIVFTDMVGSTALGEELRDEAMSGVRRAHFEQSRELIKHFQGHEIKTIGDSFMAAFKTAGQALDYARALKKDTGHPRVQIRAGIHVGQLHVEEGDVFGGTVNFAARVIGAIKGAEIWLSERAKEDIFQQGSRRHLRLRWARHEDVAMKGFSGTFTLWSIHETS